MALFFNIALSSVPLFILEILQKESVLGIMDHHVFLDEDEAMRWGIVSIVHSTCT
jgi:hypothetical protein